MTKRSQEELARLGIKMDVPKIEVAEDAPVIEPITETDLAAISRDESFMNQRIQIRLATTTDQNAPPYAVVTVNDVNNRAVIRRGVPTMVKRLHVEVLARMRETRFTQPVRNMADPEAGNTLLPQHAMVYPFEVLSDPDPRGRAWLEQVLAEAAYG